ncbi:hypothetical protein NC652_019932 [Populus alba x Populus x berolinensis]|nr:hypothetical protein NC652_019932 [Populus alba x Populus x berolinensis]
MVEWRRNWKILARKSSVHEKCVTECDYRGKFMPDKCFTGYHVPRSWFKPSGNLLVIFEEKGGDPEKITFSRRKTSSICALIAEDYPSADRKSLQEAGSKNSNSKASVHLGCPQNALYQLFGTPTGKCGSYSEGECHDPNSISVVEKACLNKTECAIELTEENFNKGLCPDFTRRLAVEALFKNSLPSLLLLLLVRNKTHLSHFQSQSKTLTLLDSPFVMPPPSPKLDPSRNAPPLLLQLRLILTRRRKEEVRVAVVDPTNNYPLECVIRRIFRSSRGDECMLLCPADTPVQILKSVNIDGWSAVSDGEVESILPAAAYALAKIHMHLVHSGLCYTARGGFCYSEDDIFDFRTDDGEDIDGLPNEGVEITCFHLDGAHYMIYTPSDPLLFVAVKDQDGQLQIADDDLLEDPAIISAIDEETEFNALVEEEAALLESLMGER